MTVPTPLLEISDLTKSFGGLVAVDNVTMAVHDNELIGLLGPNGAGKSTLINLISGFYPPDKGTIKFSGGNITHLSSHARVKRGIVRTFQLVSVFNNLTVLENAALAQITYSNKYTSPKQRFMTELLDSKVTDSCMKELQTVDLQDKANTPVANLAYGEKRKLEIVMALTLKPKLVLLDEPLSGLSEAEIPELLGVLKKASETRTILLVEHKISKISDFIRRLSVMFEGKIISDGKPDEVLKDPYVKKVYWRYEQ
jgi:branched-chain amino acid transport system ATP-binding protein